ncbi:RDD family protein [Longimicrobium sp.]|uniref:RDD family protein n=1 Tax=Longimicrobium sp. TaxID=2029185 RepID=UPI003B3AE4D6
MRSNSTFVITPDSFQISQGIIGLPLARPSRRLTAMLLDLLIVALLVKMAGPVLLGLAAAFFAFRMSRKVTGAGTRPLGRVVRFSVRAFGALILFLVATSVWGKGARTVRGIMGSQGVQMTLATGGGDSVRVSAVQALGLSRDVAAFQGADSEAEARRLAGQLVSGFRAAGVPEDEVRETLEGIAENSDRRWMEDVVQTALATPPAAASAAPSVPSVSADSLARAYAAYTAAGDTAAARRVQPQLASLLARDSLDELRGELKEAEDTNQVLTQRAERAENRGILHAITDLLDELGIGFGWTGLYFTAFLTLWRGQTPGKKLAGVRVVRLNGQPMTMWTSFERFGGYAAGLVTGLLGFAQVYWDRNRQMIHDKIVETVVVRERGAPQPAAAPLPVRPAVAAFGSHPSVRRSPGV